MIVIYKKIEFTVAYGVLKRNFLGKLTEKIKDVINVKTEILFTDEYVSVTLYGIDRNDKKGIHNEENIFYYENLSRIEFLEDVCALNIVEKENDTYFQDGEKYLTSINNSFLVDIDYIDDILDIFKELEYHGFYS